MKNAISSLRLLELFRTVFAPTASDRNMVFIVDVPNRNVPDNHGWHERRLMALEWFRQAISFREELGLEAVTLYYFENVERANADLPAYLYRWEGEPAEINSYILHKEGMPVSLDEVLMQTDIILAPTEFSATAPLKIAAKKFKFRGTTMPGFTREMIPSLGIDYHKVNEIILAFKKRLDDAEGVDILFSARGEEYFFHADLRYRKATASSGLFHEVGVVGNLPSGEAYIVPYEGERAEIPSGTKGTLPVQFGEEIVLYDVRENCAVGVLSSGETGARESTLLRDEPAYGNIAEIGFGVLGRFGCVAAGNLLMDEKLGLHIAFGRSEHFGGITSPSSFRNPKNVVHIDRVYVPSLQPDIVVKRMTLKYPAGEEVVMVDSEWMV